MAHDAIPLLIGLLAKHMVADYYLQFSWMIKEKSIYGAFGGLAHSGLHGVLTSSVLWWFGLPFFLGLAMGILDFIFHYHIDWTKSNLWKNNSFTPNDQVYWMIHGTDQFLHLMTYVLILYICLPNVLS